MRIVALEEHFIVPELARQIGDETIVQRGWPLQGSPQAKFIPTEKLIDTGAMRLADMDASGISMQVLSLSGPGADLLDGKSGPKLARQFNDRLANIVADHRRGTQVLLIFRCLPQKRQQMNFSG